MNRLARTLGLLGLMASLALPLAGQAQNAPAAVSARMAQLDGACRRAGGRPQEQAYVQVRDFTGDARPDFLIAEGDYVCGGRPGMFEVEAGESFIEIWVVEGRDAYRAYRQQVRGFRVIDTTPRKLEVTLGARDCPRLQLQCTVVLSWNAAAGRFDDRTPPPPVAARPPPRPGPATGVRETQAAFLARCQRETIAENPESRRWAADACRETWTRVTASGPAADVLMSLARARAAGPLNMGQIQAATAPIRWASRAQGGIAQGSLGRLGAGIDMRAGTLSLDWSEVGGLIPYDIPQALKVRGVVLTQVACQAVGAGERTRVYRMTGPGQAPVGLTIYEREAPTANANSTYGATVDVVRPPPTLAALRARGPDEGWAATCN